MIILEHMVRIMFGLAAVSFLLFVLSSVEMFNHRRYRKRRTR